MTNNSHRNQSFLRVQKLFRPTNRMPESDEILRQEKCRVCFSSGGDQLIQIFSVYGIELRMSEVLREHFKCDVIDADSLPNSVCQECWTTTEAFHDLYQKSQWARDKFLGSMIKIETDVPAIDYENTILVQDFNGEPLIADGIKIEPNQDSEHSDCEDTFASLTVNDEEEQIHHIEGFLDSEQPTQAKSNPLEGDEHSTQRPEDTPTSEVIGDKSGDEFPRHRVRRCKTAKEPSVVTENPIESDPDLLKCNKCDKHCRSTSELKKHQARHAKKKFICDICQKPYCSKLLLERHRKAHAEPESLNPKEDIDELPDQHRMFIVENFDMKCDQCDVVFRSLHSARLHYKVSHGNDFGYIKCCSTKLRKKTDVMDHINSHFDPEHFKCEFCSKTFTGAHALRQHHRRHLKAFTCDYCGKTYRAKDVLLKHFFTSHVTTEPKFKCDICDKRFRLELLLRTHIYGVHRDKKPIVTCEVCGKTFFTKYHLNKHMLVHSDRSERLTEKKQCEHCGEWLLSKSGMYYHEQIHKTGTHRCDRCDSVFSNKIALQGHIRKYHRERIFKCSYCERAYSTRAEHRKHEESHTRHRQYPCQFCPKVFTVPSSRLTHTRRNHGEEYRMRQKTKKLNQ